MKNEVKTLSDAIRYFADEQVCIDTVAGMRWPDGPVCPKCASAIASPALAGHSEAMAMPELRQAILRQGRHIFEDSAIKLDKWLTAMWLVANCKNGISSYELARDLGITQKSAWFVLHRVRRL
jgi:hypothetical protein